VFDALDTVENVALVLDRCDLRILAAELRRQAIALRECLCPDDTPWYRLGERVQIMLAHTPDGPWRGGWCLTDLDDGRQWHCATYADIPAMVRQWAHDCPLLEEDASDA
jgi:hypothetical protein